MEVDLDHWQLFLECGSVGDEGADGCLQLLFRLEECVRGGVVYSLKLDDSYLFLTPVRNDIIIQFAVQQWTTERSPHYKYL